MKKTPLITASVALAVSLGACKKEAEAPKPVEAATDANAISSMAMPETTHGKSKGTVTALDATKGTITLDHAEIPELKWPSMTMSFHIKPELARGVAVGDKVAFEVDWDGKAGTVTNIKKAK